MPSSPGSKERTALRNQIKLRVADMKAKEAEIDALEDTRTAVLKATICTLCSKNKLECNCGRSLVLEDEGKMALLKDAFKLGCSDRDACVYAGVGIEALQNYIKWYPRFAVEKEKLKMLPLMKAKQNVLNAIGLGNLQQSNWYLERKQRDEFGMKTEVEHSGQVTHGVIVLPALTPLPEPKKYEGGEPATPAA